MKAGGDESVRDAGLIAATQRVEHYEIAGYGTARSLARRLGDTQAAEILQETLDEEGEADQRLSEIAETEVNSAAPLKLIPTRRAESGGGGGRHGDQAALLPERSEVFYDGSARIVSHSRKDPD